MQNKLYDSSPFNYHPQNNLTQAEKDLAQIVKRISINHNLELKWVRCKSIAEFHLTRPAAKKGDICLQSNRPTTKHDYNFSTSINIDEGSISIFFEKLR